MAREAYLLRTLLSVLAVPLAAALPAGGIEVVEPTYISQNVRFDAGTVSPDGTIAVTNSETGIIWRHRDKCHRI